MTLGPVAEDKKALYGGRTLREWLPIAVAEIVAAIDPVAVYGFGSVVRGDDGPDSDLDILVVADRIEKGQHHRLMTTAYSAVSGYVPRDVLVTDLAGFEANKLRPWHIEHQVAKTGVLMYYREPKIPKEEYMSPPEPDMQADAAYWMEEASIDLVEMEHSLSMEWSRRALSDAQQAVEKALKAVLVASGAEIQKTHDLTDIVGMLPQHYASRFDPTLLVDLSPWGVQGRYPANEPDTPSEREKDRLVAAAKATVESAIEIVNMIGQEKTRDDPSHFPPPPSPGLSL